VLKVGLRGVLERFEVEISILALVLHLAQLGLFQNEAP
jgi:hypothetical protein